MAKPILFIRYPWEVKEHISDMKDNVPKELEEDYHVLFTVDRNRENIDVEVFNVLNATDVEIEQLRKEILNKLEEHDVK
jgi:hypothetical protein